MELPKRQNSEGAVKICDRYVTKKLGSSASMKLSIYNKFVQKLIKQK